MRAVIFANGTMNYSAETRLAIQAGDILIAADGGALHCQALGLTPAVVIGDFDSITHGELAKLEATGIQVIRHPARKDFTDLELALQYAVALGVDEILVFGALGARWDQTLANLLLPAASCFEKACIRLLDGPQEITLLRAAGALELAGSAGDTVSLIPLGGDAHGITTQGLEYPLTDDTLRFGATRGVSNVILGEKATVQLREGLLLCILIHDKAC
jgi:thiamine pyrophosphokinase